MKNIIRLKNIIFIGYFATSVNVFSQKINNFKNVADTLTSKKNALTIADNVKNADTRLGIYLPLLKGKKVAMVANQSSVISGVSLVDTLLSLGINIKKVFSPEHGFRGNADAGEHIKNSKDLKTGIAIISLYGKNYKPKPNDLKDIDIIVYDLQDVGARFYTYISTLFYTMQAATENNIDYLVLDRPNPNGFYVDGPVLQDSCKSYVGVIPIPIVHGCTVGELAQMIVGEGWLKTNKKLKLQVIQVENYTHKTLIEPAIKPSPNLPTIESILLYPSLCLFEGTVISLGRGTQFPFQLYGHPKFPETNFKFVPISIAGASKNPPYQNDTCYGFIVKEDAYKLPIEKQINWNYLLNAYRLFPDKEHFFNTYFKNLAGNNQLKRLIINGATAEEIRESYKNELTDYKKKRVKYLLYSEN